jgi:hypothetical protein
MGISRRPQAANFCALKCSNVARTTVAPIVGGLAMTGVAIYAASQCGLLIGNPDSPLRWILPELILVAPLAGGHPGVHSEEVLAGAAHPDGSASRH